MTNGHDTLRNLALITTSQRENRGHSHSTSSLHLAELCSRTLLQPTCSVPKGRCGRLGWLVRAPSRRLRPATTEFMLQPETARTNEAAEALADLYQRFHK